MAMKGRTPEKGASGRTFSHDTCQAGGPRTGWISGDVHVLVMHVGKGRSKPCERVLLGDSHTCPGCVQQRPREEIGFVPLRRDDGRPVAVLVRKATIDFVAHLKPGSSVLYGRNADRFEGVYVRPALKELPWSHYFSHKPDDDMSYWLPLFLGTPHLADAMKAWFANPQSDNALSPAAPLPVAPHASGELPAPTPVKVLEAEIMGATLDGTLNRLRSKQRRMKLKEGEQNGVH